MRRIDWIRRAAALALALCLLCGLAVAYAAQQSAVVYNPNPSDRLNLRERASAQSKSLGKYYNGVPITVIYTQGSWAYVRVGDVYGYMMTEFLLLDGKEGSVPSAMPKLTVINPISTDRLNLRTGPSIQSDSLAKYGNGTSVEVMGEAGDWVHVRVGGLTGYMLREYLGQQGAKPGQTDKPSGNDNGNSSAASGYAVINNASVDQALPLRGSPSTSGKTLEKYPNGTTVQLLRRQGNWYEVCVDNMTGYMQADCLRLDANYPPLASLTRAVVKAQYAGKLTVYNIPSLNTQASAAYSGSNAIRVLARAGTWYQVEIEGTEIRGYIPAHQVWVGNDAASAGGRTLGVVCNPNPKDRLNLRKSASTNGTILDRLFNGTQVEILDADNPAYKGWYRVRVAGQEGYVQAQFLDFIHWGSTASW